jgi:hypothetical protein
VEVETGKGADALDRRPQLISPFSPIRRSHNAQVLAEIGRRLRDEYDIAEPLPDRLASLVRQVERSGIEIACTPITARDP